MAKKKKKVRAPVFEGHVDPNTPAGQIQGMANIADAFHDGRDPVRRRFAQIMVFTLGGGFAAMIVVMAIAFII